MNTGPAGPNEPSGAPEAASPSKWWGGLRRIGRAFDHSVRGLRAAWTHEAAFRQELLAGGLLVLLVPWVAATAWQAVALVGAVVLVLIVELLNSAIESLADAVSLEHHPLLGRAKDLGSAAVFLSLLLAGAVWLVAIVDRFLS